MLFCMETEASKRQRKYRLPRIALKLASFFGILILLLECGLFFYSRYLLHKALRLREEAAQIQIGASEESILPFVRRYGGTRELPSKPGPRPAWCIKGYCDWDIPPNFDYSYEITLSPLNVFSGMFHEPGSIQYTLAYLMFRTPSALRNLLFLRNWKVSTTIKIRNQQIQTVFCGLWVEGLSRWLGDDWGLSNEMHGSGKQQKAYYADGYFLLVNYRGNGVYHNLTLAATPEQIQAAHSLNENCVTGLIPCRCLSELIPNATHYLSHHPDDGSLVMTDDCPTPQKF
jgi:hypothetical protein